MLYNVILGRVRVTIIGIQQQYILDTKCVSEALVTHHAKRMRRIILSSVASPAAQYFSTLSHKRHDFRDKKLLKIKCVI